MLRVAVVWVSRHDLLVDDSLLATREAAPHRGELPGSGFETRLPLHFPFHAKRDTQPQS